ncbi:tRNA-dependent cyclodipeptide synthase [Frischella perrara]|uniref:Cyclodipeptide synthase n=1 Tax=Frischella perrara TaxID=1267021 RepID=A0A0A7S2I2_FRIPE|nr:hypothetical protein FPB0191_01905 [Frischella perrara]PWV60329.1 tRNA-dependent cyclodipeptide synthase [Frischella perrara]
MKGKHVLFGISPFNSKFDESYIKNMLEWEFMLVLALNLQICN